MTSVFDHSDYRAFLKAYIKALPKNGRGEIGRIAKNLSVSSTLISQVLMGIKQLTPEQSEALSEHLGLSPTEQEFLIYLVQYDRSGTQKLKSFWNSKIVALREESKKIATRVNPKRVLSEEERSVFYSSPLYSAIRLFTSTSDKGKTLDEIVSRFELTRLHAKKMITFLANTGLLTEIDGHYKMGMQSTHIESGSPHLLKHHANWRVKAIQYSELISESELMYTAPVSLSKQDFDRLREKMVIFIKAFLDEVHSSPAEEIACFNMDFFWAKK